MAPVKPLDFIDFSQSLGPGYRKPRFMPSDVGGRRANCVPMGEVLKANVTWDEMISYRGEVIDHINHHLLGVFG